MLILKLIRKLYKGLTGAESPTQISLGVGLGVMVGMVSAGTGIGILLLAAILIFTVSFPFALVGWAFGALLRASIFGGLIVDVGRWLLEEAPLHGFWTFVLNLPVIGLLGLRYWKTMGGLVIGLLLAIALFWPVRMLVIRYREAVVARLSKSRAFRYVTNLWLVRVLRWILIGPMA